MQKKLRFGILIDDTTTVKVWQKRCIDKLMALDTVELIGFYKPKVDSVNSDNQSVFQKLFNPKLAWTLFWKIFRPSEVENVGLSAKDIPVTEIELVQEKNNRYRLSEKGEVVIREQNVDVLLRFGWGILSGEILNIPRYGVWSFHHNDPHVFRGGPPAFWEIFTGKPTQGLILQQLNEILDGGKIIADGKIATEPHSFKVSFDNVLKVSDLVLEKAILKTLLEPEVLNRTIDRSKGRFVTFPNTIQTLQMFCKLIANKAYFQWVKRCNQENWRLALSKPLDVEKLATPDCKLIQPGLKNTFLADPFLLPNNEGILAEYYDFNKKKGIIVWLDLNGDNQKIVLETDLHLSYPFVFIDGEKTYVLPESSKKEYQAVYTWNSINKSLEWQFDLNIKNCVDPSLLFYDNRYWLFCTHPENSNSVLYIYSAKSLEDEFIPHALNPIKIDVQTARPAGNFVIQNGDLYRPAQNNDLFYGNGINWMKIKCLTVDAFEEEKVQYWPANLVVRGAKGVHHYSTNYKQSVLDFKTKNGQE